MALKLALDVNRAIPHEQECYLKLFWVSHFLILPVTLSVFVNENGSKDNTEPMCVFEQHMWCCIPE